MKTATEPMRRFTLFIHEVDKARARRLSVNPPQIRGFLTEADARVWAHIHATLARHPKTYRLLDNRTGIEVTL